MNILPIVANLIRNKGRTLLTVSAVAVGVFSVTVISAVSRTGTEKINSTLCDMGINSVMVEPTERITLTENDVQVLKTVDGISDVMPLMVSVTKCHLLSSDIPCMAWGVSKNADEIISLRAVHGRLINENDISSFARTCVIDEQIALQSYGRTNVVGKNIDIYFSGNSESFEIIGVATSGLSVVQSAATDIVPYFIYIPYTTSQKISGKNGYDRIAILTEDNSSNKKIIDSVSDTMERINGAGSVSVNNLLGEKKQIDEIVSIISAALSVIAGISLIVSGLSVMNVMLVSVGERKREIGIKKSLGAKNSGVVAEFIAESVLLSVSGSVIGVVVGNLISYAGCLLISQNYYFETKTALAAIAVSAVIGVISGSYPAYKAACMKPIDALR